MEFLKPHPVAVGVDHGLSETSTKLIAATSDNILWARDPVLSDVNWQQIGTADDIVGMVVVSPKLFAATRRNVLWACDIS